MLEGSPPTQDDIDHAVRQLIPYYPKSREPLVLTLLERGDDNALLELIDDVMETVRGDASSGFPLLRVSPTKGPLLSSHHRAIIRQAVLERLRVWLRHDFEDRSPERLVEMGFVDPVALFVKAEPHHREKIGGRERLIASVSVVDEIIARLLMRNQNKIEIAKWATIPSQPGMGASDEMLKVQTDWIDARCRAGFELADSDVSGWDIGTKEWQYQADVSRRVQLVDWSPSAGGRREMFRRLLTVHHHCLTHSLFVLSDGTTYAQEGGGWMKSGSYVTSSTNSFQRCHLAVLSGSHPACVKAMGDDCIEEGGNETWKKGFYARMGFILKQFNMSHGYDVEFCAHRFSRSGRVYRDRIEKSLYSLVSNPFSVPLLDQFKFEFRHSLSLQPVLDGLAGSGWIPANAAKESGGWSLVSCRSESCGGANSKSSPPTSNRGVDPAQAQAPSGESHED